MRLSSPLVLPLVVASRGCRLSAVCLSLDNRSTTQEEGNGMGWNGLARKSMRWGFFFRSVDDGETTERGRGLLVARSTNSKGRHERYTRGSY